MKKRKVLITILILLYVLFIGYKYQLRNGEIKQTQRDTLKVVTSFYPMYMHTREIMKGTPHELINMASQTVGCLHDYQLTVQDAKKLYEADALIINGLGSENFIEKAYKQSNNLRVINASSMIEEYLHEEEGADSLEEEVHDHNHDHDTVNDHIWLSIDGSIMQVQQITKELVEMDPIYAKTYEQNAKAYIEALEKLQETVEESFSTMDEELKVVSVHDAFTYLMEDFGIEIVETIPEGSYENASAKQIENLIKHMKADGVQIIVTEAKNKELALLNMLQREMECRVYVLDALVTSDESLNLEDTQSFEYIVRMEKNIETLKEAFSHE